MHDAGTSNQGKYMADPVFRSNPSCPEVVKGSTAAARAALSLTHLLFGSASLKIMPPLTFFLSAQHIRTSFAFYRLNATI